LENRGSSRFHVRKPFLKKINATFHNYRNLILLGFFSFLSIFSLVVSYTDFEVSRKVRVFVMDATDTLAEAAGAPNRLADQFVQGVQDWAFAYRRVQELSRENKQLRDYLARMRVLREENKNLKKLLKVTERHPRKIVGGKVVIYPGRPFVKSILIDSGAAEGMETHLPVITEEGLVGRTLEVADHTTRALLLTDLNSKIPVIVKPINEQAILVGDNTEMPRLKYLPYESKVQPGHVIETSGRGGIFPAGVLVGVVESVKEGKVKIKTAVDLEALSFVTAVSSSLDPQLMQSG
jgi:rod shape-determining protein MreC